jgi:hypothetical protein
MEGLEPKRVVAAKGLACDADCDALPHLLKRIRNTWSRSGACGKYYRDSEFLCRFLGKGVFDIFFNILPMEM